MASLTDCARANSATFASIFTVHDVRDYAHNYSAFVDFTLGG